MTSSSQAPDSNPRKSILSDEALDQIFREARTHWIWRPEPVPEALLREAYNLARLGPTSANTSPGRFVFVSTPAAKERLKPALMPGNVEKTMTAPVTAIVCWDVEFYEKLPKLLPGADMRAVFSRPNVAEDTGFRNSSLEGAYFIIAARALGLDCGPMSGFDRAKVDAEFFPDGKWKSNFLCNVGHGDASKIFPRAPRLDFEEACVIL